MPADATFPTTPAFEPDLVLLPIPVDPTTPCGATAGPCIPPKGFPMAAIVAGRVALGLGVAPKVWPRCTGAVEGLTLLSCAGMAAVKAALGCGARMIAGLGSFIAGIGSLASIWIGFGSGFGFGIAIFGASICILGRGVGVWATINSVISYLCT